MGAVPGSYYSIQNQIHPLPLPYKTKLEPLTFKIKAAASSSSSSSFSSKSKDGWTTPPPITRKGPNTARRLISIATADGKWNGKWTSDYIVSLEDLKLADVAEDRDKDAEVLIKVTVERHASFGFSVEGRIITSFNRKCGNCSSLYCREIDTTFNVWVLPSRREKRSMPLPDIGGDDPSVIYVKPGCEADLDSLVRDTIRLVTSVNEMCSGSCEKSEQRWQCINREETIVDGRWSRLLELRNLIEP